ncbi:unnamed protein product [Pleuronectes platessa]|uniref:Uncharacterized protein n=1 Tax=Pleuronectes platessa TaxID=8262 RepID=A0A9N7VM23_PLEPL|nr:unnamed protein product [Pleuronectes platessa]
MQTGGAGDQPSDLLVIGRPMSPEPQPVRSGAFTVGSSGGLIPNSDLTSTRDNYLPPTRFPVAKIPTPSNHKLKAKEDSFKNSTKEIGRRRKERAALSARPLHLLVSPETIPSCVMGTRAVADPEKGAVKPNRDNLPPA